MKKELAILAAFMIAVAVFFGCQKDADISEDANSDGTEEYVTAENTCPYALLYDGVMYYYTGEYIFEDVEYSEDDILGSVTSTVSETKMPSLDRQANIDIEGSIFMKHELADDGLLVLIDGKWNIFEIRGQNE